MSQELGIAVPDIVSTLLDMKMLVCYRTQYYIINNKVSEFFTVFVLGILYFVMMKS